jgi:hypothetical protein
MLKGRFGSKSAIRRSSANDRKDLPHDWKEQRRFLGFAA